MTGFSNEASDSCGDSKISSFPLKLAAHRSDTAAVAQPGKTSCDEMRSFRSGSGMQPLGRTISDGSHERVTAEHPTVEFAV